MHSLMGFFKQYRNETDIFCLQEIHDTTQEYREKRHSDEWVRWDLWERIQKALPDFYPYFARFGDNLDRMSVAMLIRHGAFFSGVGDIRIYDPANPLEEGSAVIAPRKLQYARIFDGAVPFILVNYHGLWIPENKHDSPERISQSLRIQQFLDEWPCPVVLCGDFNLEPQTKAMAILEKGMRNLIKEHSIQSTRTPLYRGYNDPGESQFADYILVSPGVKVNGFRVMSNSYPNLCSDHAPLYLDFSVS
jgi:endonuclease/exonuclease/phosphatase family metal-dependent hydrolase